MSILAATLHALATITCPSWCALPTHQHGGPGSLDAASGDRYIGHARPIAAAVADWRVDLVRDDVHPPVGPVEHGAPTVLLNQDGERPLTPHEARELAAALLAAADVADGTVAGYIGRHAVDTPTVALAAVPARATAGAA